MLRLSFAFFGILNKSIATIVSVSQSRSWKARTSCQCRNPNDNNHDIGFYNISRFALFASNNHSSPARLPESLTSHGSPISITIYDKPSDCVTMRTFDLVLANGLRDEIVIIVPLF